MRKSKSSIFPIKYVLVAYLKSKKREESLICSSLKMIIHGFLMNMINIDVLIS
jgi:hypothetical protein